MIKRKFELDWGTGGLQIVEGEDIAQAMMLAGYSGGAARALKSWKTLPRPTVKSLMTELAESQALIDELVRTIEIMVNFYGTELGTSERYVLDLTMDRARTLVAKAKGGQP